MILGIKTHLPNINLPQASLYKINPAASGQFLVETDPRFLRRDQNGLAVTICLNRFITIRKIF